IPYLLMMAMASISLAFALLYFHNFRGYIYSDWNPYLYWAWLPVLGGLLAYEKDGAERLGHTMLAVALTLAMIAAVRAELGMHVLPIAQTGGAQEAPGLSQSEFVRVQMPAFVFVLWATTAMALRVAQRRVGYLIALPIIGVLLMGLYFNFGRALWIWTIVAIAASLRFVDRERAVKLVALAGLAAALGIGGLIVAKPRALEAVAYRFASIEQEGGGRTSYGLRQWENEIAVHQILRSPFIGVGIGGEYRRWSPTLVNFSDHVRYIHNSYLYLSLKIGLPGLAMMLWLLIGSWLRGRKLQGNKRDGWNNPYQLTCLSVLPAVLCLCVTQPELMEAPSILFFVCLLNLLCSGSAPSATVSKAEPA
ncbi:MAG: O-antigen ligase family protein, partial [Burkholderiales bacterium]|nr:O-antigen ligase family protein [Burkholderiales bacterium]